MLSINAGNWGIGLLLRKKAGLDGCQTGIIFFKVCAERKKGYVGKDPIPSRLDLSDILI
jgi:hypothetical protein